jgi:heptosyltransferase I
MSDGPSENIRRVLLVSANHLGDCVAFLPVAAAVRRHLPDARITMLTRRVGAEVTRLTGCVDDFMIVPPPDSRIRREMDVLRSGGPLPLFFAHAWGRFADFRKQSGALRKERFDLAFMASGESSAIAALLFLGRVRKRIGFADCRLQRLLSVRVEAREPELEAQRNLRLLRAAGLPDALERPPCRVPQERAAEALTLIAKGGARVGRRVLIHPGSSQPNRRWPAAKFADLCSRLIRTGLAQPILVEGPAEPGLGAEIHRISAGPLPVLSQLAGIESLAAAMSQCDLFVGQSSGPLHVAFLLGLPSVSLWGYSDPGIWGPAWEQDRHVLIRSPLPCAGCEHWDPKRHVFIRGPESGAAGGRPHCERCFDSITVDAVFEAVRKQLLRIGS